MAVVTPHPTPHHIVARRGFVESAPQLAILHRLLVGRLPAVLFPARQPLGETVHDIAGIGVEHDGAGLLQRFQRLDGGHQLHAVVGGHALAAEDLLLVRAGAQDRTPAARPGIAAACAVGKDLDGGAYAFFVHSP
jgi:hypothetical protein